MKTFFATAAIAAIAVADGHEECDAEGKCWWVEEADIKRDIERAIEDMCEIFEDAREGNPEEMMEEA